MIITSLIEVVVVIIARPGRSKTSHGMYFSNCLILELWTHVSRMILICTDSTYSSRLLITQGHALDQVLKLSNLTFPFGIPGAYSTSSFLSISPAKAPCPFSYLVDSDSGLSRSQIQHTTIAGSIHQSSFVVQQPIVKVGHQIFLFKPMEWATSTLSGIPLDVVVQ